MHPHEIEHLEHIIGSVVGMIYDTTGWPVPDEVYHPDNRHEWHCDDPNMPWTAEEEMEQETEGAR